MRRPATGSPEWRRRWRDSHNGTRHLEARDRHLPPLVGQADPYGDFDRGDGRRGLRQVQPRRGAGPGPRWSSSGDDFHSDGESGKDAPGIALTDADRGTGWMPWLHSCEPIGTAPCSPARRSRQPSGQTPCGESGLAFVHLQISPHDALQRVTSRANGHFFCASLVDSQFATLEPPFGEPRVALDALLPLNESTAQAVRWQVEEIEARQGSDER